MMIHWEEGLHLLPQHLQRLQWSIANAFAQQYTATHGSTGGFLRLETSVVKGKVAVEELQAMMPSGVYLVFTKSGRNVDIPPKDVAGALAAAKAPARGGPKAVNLYLGLPNWKKNGANSYDLGHYDPRLERRYVLHEEELADENKESGEARSIRERRYSGRLLLDTDSSEGMDRLFLGRLIQAGSGDAEATFDPETCPPILRLPAWPRLRKLIDDLVDRLDHCRGSLTGRIQDGGFVIGKLHGDQLGLLLRLRSVNHFLPKLKAMLAVEETPPFAVFAELLALCGELVALVPAKETAELLEYDAEAPLDGFKALVAKILRNLEETPPPRMTRIPFERAGPERTWKAHVPEDLLAEGRTFHLQVDAQVIPPGDRETVRDVRRRCGLTLTPYPQLWKTRATEIDFEPVRTPDGYPGQLQYTYFAVPKLVAGMTRTGPDGKPKKETELGLGWINDEGIVFNEFALLIQ